MGMEYISLNSNDIGDSGALSLISVLYDSENITELDLINNKITTKGFKDIMMILQNRSQLTTFHVHLQDNEDIELSYDDIVHFSNFSKVVVSLNATNVDRSTRFQLFKYKGNNIDFFIEYGPIRLFYNQID